MTVRATSKPAPLVVAASLVAVEGLLLLAYAVLEVANTGSGRVTMAATTSLFFIGYGVALLVCAWGLAGLRSWARSPVVLTQLIQLCLAWSFWGGDTTGVAIAIAVVALLALAGVFHPASLEALSPDLDEPGDGEAS